jgi:hypothetical protein
MAHVVLAYIHPTIRILDGATLVGILVYLIKHTGCKYPTLIPLLSRDIFSGRMQDSGVTRPRDFLYCSHESLVSKIKINSERCLCAHGHQLSTSGFTSNVVIRNYVLSGVIHDSPCVACSVQPHQGCPPSLRWPPLLQPT